MISAPGTLPEHPYFNCKYNDYFLIPPSIGRAKPLKRE